MPKTIKVALEPGDDVRLANNLQVGLCDDPRCGRVHLMFADDKQKPFAMAVLSIDQAVLVMGDLRQYVAALQLAELDRKQKDQRKVSDKRGGADHGEHE
jgi:uncharacterized small protein (DUF1192 family)